MQLLNHSFNPSEDVLSESSSQSTLNEGEIAGVLIGCVFLVFLVLPITLSYILVYCKRLHAALKSRRAVQREYSDRTSFENVGVEPGDHLQHQDGQTVIVQEEHLPNAELTRSEPPPSYIAAVIGDQGDPLLPPTYNSALEMQKV